MEQAESRIVVEGSAHELSIQTICEGSTPNLPPKKFPFRRERESFYFKSHISLWEHSSHFRLIGRGVPSVLFLS